MVLNFESDNPEFYSCPATRWIYKTVMLSVNNVVERVSKETGAASVRI